MTKLPVKLEHDTIIEAIFELRFETDLPSEAVFGMIYQIIFNIFGDLKYSQLPFSQLPEEIRNNDPQFRYQAFHRLLKDNLCFGVGARVISFSVLRNYIGWSEWRPKIIEIIDKLSEGQIIKSINRMSLRYLNFIERDIFPFINAEIKLIDETTNPSATALRSEIIEDEYLKIIQIANKVSLTNNINPIGSLIDIEIVSNKKISKVIFKDNFDSKLEQSHKLAKRLFFDILKKDFLNELGPVYDGGADV